MRGQAARGHDFPLKQQLRRQFAREIRVVAVAEVYGVAEEPLQQILQEPVFHRQVAPAGRAPFRRSAGAAEPVGRHVPHHFHAQHVYHFPTLLG